MKQRALVSYRYICRYLHTKILLDDLLVQMKNVSDHCDEEYKKTVKQLEDEDIENRFHQENLDKELVRLERERELEAAVEEEKQKHQEQIIEKLEVLQNRLQKVVSTLTVEEYHQRDGNQVQYCPALDTSNDQDNTSLVT